MEQQNNPYQPPLVDLDPATKSAAGARPTSITVVCIIGFLGAFASAALLYSGAADAIGAWYQYYLGFASVVGLACFIGLWRMKKLAAYAYTALTVTSQAVLLATGLWSIGALIIPAIVVFIALKNTPRMS